MSASLTASAGAAATRPSADAQATAATWRVADDSIAIELPTRVRCYQSGRGRVIHLGVIFFLLFCPYLMLQAFAVTIYGEKLASNMLVALYASFALSCLGAPAVVNMLGPRPALSLGVLSYVPIPISSLLLATFGPQADWCHALVISAGALSGVGGSCMWTAQGRLMLEAAKEDGSAATSFGIFWGFFSCAAVAGGLFTFGFYSVADGTHNRTAMAAGGEDDNGELQPRPPTSLLYVYISLMLSAVALSLCVGRGSAAINAAEERPSEPLTSRSLHDGGSPKTRSWIDEVRHTLAMVCEPRIRRVGLLFFYSGFNQPYQLDTFGNRLFTPRALGLELVVFYVMGAVGGAVAGRMLDGHDAADGQRAAAYRTLMLFLASNGVAFALAAYNEANALTDETVLDMGIGRRAAVPATIAYALWGFADAQVQGYVYWLLPLLFRTGEQQAHAVGLFKMIQALGWAVGFVLVPVHRVPALMQLTLTAACCLASTLIALTRRAMP